MNSKMGKPINASINPKPGDRDRIEPMPLRFGRLCLRPGNILVLLYPGSLSAEASARLQDSVRAQIPESIKVWVIEEGTQVGVIRGPGA